MSLLGGFFPEEARKAHAVGSMTTGRVLYLACDFTVPPKEKYIFLATPDEPPLLFVINSEISAYIDARPDLKACQVTLQVADHAFLARDSVLDCSNVIDSMSKDDVLKQLTAEPGRIRGEVSAAARAGIVAAVRQARTISRIHKQVSFLLLWGLRILSSRQPYPSAPPSIVSSDATNSHCGVLRSRQEWGAGPSPLPFLPSDYPQVLRGFCGYQAGSWKTARRVVAKVELHCEELFPQWASS